MANDKIPRGNIDDLPPPSQEQQASSKTTLGTIDDLPPANTHLPPVDEHGNIPATYQWSNNTTSQPLAGSADQPAQQSTKQLAETKKKEDKKTADEQAETENSKRNL